ncbi:carbohydrate porin [Stenotrophomonas sp. PS02289]|uniref:carbohydrate porin n=1 Tax=Stenotrophomonas sp. PS02289 TaxID=2991422 RepID=UPI0030147CC6
MLDAISEASKIIDSTASGRLSAVHDVHLSHEGYQRRLSLYLNGTVVDRRTSTIDRTIAIGASLSGFVTRPDDELGLSIATSHLNSRVSADRRLREVYGSGVRPGNDEFAAEFYYRVKLGPHLSFSPDLQWIKRPGGNGDRGDVVIIGARTSVSF